MRLTKKFSVKDILDYELENDLSIIEELQNGSLFILIDLIKLGNNCDDAEAESILDKALNEMSYTEVIEELAYELIGKRPDENDEVIESNNITTFSDVLENFYSEIQTVDERLSLSEFWSMSPKEIYKYADGLKKRYINNKNREMQSQYTNVVMFMGALAGKLKDCPVLDDNGNIKKKTVMDKLLDYKNSKQ